MFILQHRKKQIPIIEPISVAYAGAKAAEVLGKTPDRVLVEASDNIIKNVKSVVVPNTGNLRGIQAVAVAGNADLALEVISNVTDVQKAEMKSFLKDTKVEVV